MRGFSSPSFVMRALWGAIFWLCALSVDAIAAPPGVDKVRVQTNSDFTRIVLETNAPIEPVLFTLGAPHRLVIDLPELQWRIPRPSGPVDSMLIKRFSFGLFQPGVSRLILNLAAPTKVLDRRLKRKGSRFIYQIDLATPPVTALMTPSPSLSVVMASKVPTLDIPVEELPLASVVDPAKKSVFAGRSFDPEKAQFDELSAIIAAALEENNRRPKAPALEDVLKSSMPHNEDPTPDNQAPDLASAPDSATERDINAEFAASKSEGISAKTAAATDIKPETVNEAAREIEAIQSRKSKRPPLRIVLDPGHGGGDPGTGSESGVSEKSVNLAFAKRLADLLQSDPNYEVFLTRDIDKRVRLPMRVAFARRQEADLFISIHADWNAIASVKGATAYTLSEKASVRALDKIATKREKAGRVAGVDLAAEREDVARLLVDLARRETQARSVKFAELVIDELAKETAVLRRPLRKNSFHVLKAPDMPSVLLELGFLSNETDRKLLQSDAWRLKTSKAVKKAIDAWRLTLGHRDFANQ